MLIAIEASIPQMKYGKAFSQSYLMLWLYLRRVKFINLAHGLFPTLPFDLQSEYTMTLGGST